MNTLFSLLCESRLNGGFSIIGIAKRAKTKGSGMEPSPWKAGIMAKWLGLFFFFAAAVLCCVEWKGYA